MIPKAVQVFRFVCQITALGIAVSSSAAREFVRRLALAAVTGNGDMHLKNWSLIYRGKGDKPALVPVYDVLSTVPYLASGTMALSLAGEGPFKAMHAQRWKVFANRARRPEAAVLKAVTNTVSASTSSVGRGLNVPLFLKKCWNGSIPT